MRLPVVEAAAAGGGRVAGRLHLAGARAGRLVDASGEVALVAVEPQAAEGDWVSGELSLAPGGAARLARVVVHAPCLGPSPDPGLASRLPALRRRAAIVAEARAFFHEQGFLEASTPARVRCPGLEPHLFAFPAGVGRWLITSPELHLKRLLAAGAERVVELARAFRDDERGRWHLAEFTLVEWYRAFAGLDALEEDCRGLVTGCARAAGLGDHPRIAACDLAAPWERTTVRDALVERTGIDLDRSPTRDELAEAVGRLGHATGDGDTWDDLFFRVWIAEVEPFLGLERPVFVHEWPESQAALARLRPAASGRRVAERFELYVAGVELANAFDELNEPAEQRRRHEADRAARRAAGRDAYELDEAFLAALVSGMPPAAGIALGLDRLVALLCGAASLAEVTAFPDED